MPQRFLAHARGNAVAYVALFLSLGGSSYAAVQLSPGSVRTRTLANGAVTKAKLAGNSVGSTQVVDGSLVSKDFKPGALLQGLKGDVGEAGHVGSSGATGLSGLAGLKGAQGDAGPVGAAGPAGHDGSASIGEKARLAGPVTAPHGASTNTPLTATSWTQSSGELDLITGSATIQVPSTCTGSFGNSLMISVDGKAQTFAVAPTAPASSTITVPLVVGTLTEPNNDTQHTVTAAFANSCTKSGEDYTVSDVKLDVVKFR
jgi:hypothetical protein